MPNEYRLKSSLYKSSVEARIQTIIARNNMYSHVLNIRPARINNPMGKKDRLFRETSYTDDITFEFGFSDLIGTSYVKNHLVGDIKSIFFGVPKFSSVQRA